MFTAMLQVLSLEASLSALQSESRQSDSSLKARMQELLSELNSALQVHPRAGAVDTCLQMSLNC